MILNGIVIVLTESYVYHILNSLAIVVVIYFVATIYELRIHYNQFFSQDQLNIEVNIIMDNLEKISTRLRLIYNYKAEFSILLLKLHSLIWTFTKYDIEAIHLRIDASSNSKYKLKCHKLGSTYNAKFISRYILNNSSFKIYEISSKRYRVLRLPVFTQQLSTACLSKINGNQLRNVIKFIFDKHAVDSC